MSILSFLLGEKKKTAPSPRNVCRSSSPMNVPPAVRLPTTCPRCNASWWP